MLRHIESRAHSEGDSTVGKQHGRCPFIVAGSRTKEGRHVCCFPSGGQPPARMFGRGSASERILQTFSLQDDSQGALSINGAGWR